MTDPGSISTGDVVSSRLAGVPETGLWTLHNRANEAMRSDTYLPDADCVRIYRSIDYDYVRSFGKPDDSHAMRSKMFDDALRPWLAAHPGGTVVELAAGLETQYQRCDDGRVHWVCIDVPEAIAMRRRFLPESERCRYLERSALDLAWMDEIDASNGLFVSAQGLFMYFEEAEVRRLVVAIVERFAGVELMFDVIPPWFSRLTLRGYRRTPHYTAPPMPWGIKRSRCERVLRGWSPRIESVTASSYGMVGNRRGDPHALLRLFGAMPLLRDLPPCIVRIRSAKAAIAT